MQKSTTTTPNKTSTRAPNELNAHNNTNKTRTTNARTAHAPHTRDDELLEPAASSDGAELPGGQGRPRPREVELSEVRRHEGKEQGDGQSRRPGAGAAGDGFDAPPLEVVADV